MPGFVCSGDEYVKFLSDLRREIDLQSPGVSFQEVSHTAWDERSANPQPDPGPEPPDKQSTDHGKTIHNNAAKNLILYGTPGTGKTYSSIQHAVAIVEKKLISEIRNEDYAAVFSRYLKYKDDGLIAFTTFHQSFSYEEFIEGIGLLCLIKILLSVQRNMRSKKKKFYLKNAQKTISHL